MRFAVPLPILSSRSRLLHAAALTAAVFLSCDKSPFEPLGEGERVPIDREITDVISGDTAGRYSFVGEGSAVYAIFLQALTGSVAMYVVDSTHNVTVAALFSGPGSPPLYENASASLSSGDGAVYNIKVQAPPATSARFRFIIYPINRAPEHTPATFALGDTVIGETIDPIVDLDAFFMHGEAGQEIVAVGETPGPAGSGSVAISVIDPAANQFLGYVFADAGTSTPLTTGRLRLPGTHDYRFSAGSVTSNTYPRYKGPYRFWTYVINPAPEHRSAAIPFNTEIANERIDRAGDADEFTFAAAAGADFNAFVQGTGRTFQVEVSRAGGGAAPIAVAASQPADTALFAHATSRFRTTSAGTYGLRVTGSTPTLVADTGAYRVYLYAIDRQPEHVAAAIAPGDTVSGEDLALAGDIDEFTFSGLPGEEFNAFLQAQNGSSDTHLQLDLVNPAGTVLRSAESVGSDTSLLRQVTGRFSIPSAGTYRLRVSGSQSYNNQDRGPYRLFLYRIDRKPETSAEILALGDSISGESIDLPGDVDEFRVTVTDSSGANLAFALEDPPVGGSLAVQLVDSATGRVLASASAYSAGRGALGRMRLGPGKYLVRADGNQYGNEYADRATLRGAYRLWFYRLGFGPEIAADTFAIGDTVSGESIEPWGDRDVFHFYGLWNQHINIMVQGLSAPSAANGVFEFFVIPPPGAPGYGAFINTTPATAALEDHQTTRLDLPATGWYTVQVDGLNGGFDERGPYRFTVLPIDPGPEHVSSTLDAGDSVITEPIDAPGDWDEFTVLGTPGQLMSVVFESNEFTGLYLRVFDAATNDTLAWQPNQFHRIAGPFRIPASGQVKISVSQPAGFFRICYDATCSGLFNAVGPYRFHVVAVNPAPENTAAAYTVGDTVRGETIAPVADIDEFTATGAPGDQLTLYDRLTTPTALLDSAIVIEVIDPATGVSLAGHGAAVFGSSTFYQIGTFTVPASGTFHPARPRLRRVGVRRRSDRLRVLCKARSLALNRRRPALAWRSSAAPVTPWTARSRA